MTDPVVAIIGAGAMGSALAIVHHRAGCDVTLIGTHLDDDAIAAYRSGSPHPGLGVDLPEKVELATHNERAAPVARADRIVLAPSSDGLSTVVADVVEDVSSRASWIVATKGWDPTTLRAPSEVVLAATPDAAVIVAAGPAIARELARGAPTAMVCASASDDAAAATAETLRRAGVAAQAINDVPGAEVAAAYKNVTAIGVGICEGLGDHTNARAAVFALGLADMRVLVAARGGRDDTIFGLAGVGDLYVTCLGGRNGEFGRLIGAGSTPEEAQDTIGSTVEGVANTRAALAIAKRQGSQIAIARLVGDVLAGRDARDAVAECLTDTGS